MGYSQIMTQRMLTLTESRKVEIEKNGKSGPNNTSTTSTATTWSYQASCKFFNLQAMTSRTLRGIYGCIEGQIDEWL